MKKILLILLSILFISCATTKNVENKNITFPWSTFNLKAGEEIQMPIDCGFVSYGKTKIIENDWDYSIPKEFGNKVLVASFPYTFYFEGKKQEVFYEIIIKDINLNNRIQELQLFSEIKAGTIIGTAGIDNPGLMIRTVTGYDPNLILDSQNPPIEIGKYTYYDASSFMPTTPKLLTFQPIVTKKDLIEFWDYPETIEDIAAQSNKENNNRDHIVRLPNFKILLKTQLDKYPEPIRTESKSDLTLRTQFYSFCNTEQVINFDGIPFHLLYYKDYEKLLNEEYKLGDDIYLYLVFLFGKNGEQFFYVREFSLKSPEQLYNNRLDLIDKILRK
ncbi:MAG: hypothetical protein K6A15_02880 [Treponema sp.]|nr:hypothetical protein [Treponema sp.]